MRYRFSRRISGALFLICCVVSAASPAFAEDDDDEIPPTLQITTNLLDAEPGSWIRHYNLGGNTFTNYVLDADDDTVTLQQIYQHHHRVRFNRRLVLSRDAIARSPIDANAADARPVELTHRGKTYQTRAVRRIYGDKAATFYICDEIPVSGILRVDVEREGSPLILWNDEYGSEPDELIESAGAP